MVKQKCVGVFFLVCFDYCPLFLDDDIKFEEEKITLRLQCFGFSFYLPAACRHIKVT